MADELDDERDHRRYPQGDDVVDRAQCADDRRWCAGDLLARDRRRGRHCLFRMAADLQRHPAPGVFLAGGRPGAVVWEMLLGILYGGIGFYLLAQPGAGLASLTLALAFYLVFEGVLEFVLSFQLRPLPGSGWLLFDGIVTLVLAAMIGSAWPISSVWAIGTLVGVSMFFSGITRLMLSVAAAGSWRNGRATALPVALPKP